MTAAAVVFASKLGRTRKTAKYIASSIGADIFDLKEQSVIDLSRFDRVLIGTGVYAGRPNKSVVQFVEKNRGQMSGKDVKLFICCAMRDEEAEAQAKRLSELLGIPDATFFSGSRKKNAAGLNPAVDEYLKSL